MKYTVEVRNQESEYTDCTRKQAEEIANAEASKGNTVFVTWFRASDGQRGYLNPDGSHEITGKRW